MRSPRETFVFCRALTRTGKLVHLGIDCHPDLRPGHPNHTLCGRAAVSLPIDANPWEGVADVECMTCLSATPGFMHLQGWPSVKAALAVFRNHHRRLAREERRQRDTA